MDDDEEDEPVVLLFILLVALTPLGMLLLSEMVFMLLLFGLYVCLSVLNTLRNNCGIQDVGLESLSVEGPEAEEPAPQLRT